MKLRKIIAYPLSIIFIVFFFVHLLLFQPLQWLALKLTGSKGHRIVVNVLNFFLLADLLCLGARTIVKGHKKIPKNRALIIVANHQSMFDIPVIIWYLRKHKPKFIAKKSLGRGIPSISFNLKHGGNVLIDRKNSKQSIPRLQKFGKFIAANKFAAVIFPEGTRSRDGIPRKFAPTGLKVLFEQMPEAAIVPITINNSWKLFQYGKFPLGIGFSIKLQVHDIIELKEKEQDHLLKEIENQICSSIEY